MKRYFDIANNDVTFYFEQDLPEYTRKLFKELDSDNIEIIAIISMGLDGDLFGDIFSIAQSICFECCSHFNTYTDSYASIVYTEKSSIVKSSELYSRIKDLFLHV